MDGGYIYLSLGDHWISSTDPVWPISGLWSTVHVPASFGFQIWISLLQSPVANTYNNNTVTHELLNPEFSSID